MDVVKDDTGEVVEVHCTWDPESRGGNAPDGRKVRGTIHWVSAAHAVDAEVRTPDGGVLLPRIQAWLTEAGQPLSQLEVERPNLETLYLNLTGRALRE